MNTNDRAFVEVQYAVNHWFQFMNAETRAKAVAYAQGWAKETAFQAPVITETAKPVSVPPVNSGRGKANIGKVWMVNKATSSLVRALPEQVAGLEARGYVRGGPRSI
jgi:hypothetical protein